MKMIIILIFKVKRYFEIGTFRRKKERLSKVFQAIVGKKALSDRYPKKRRDAKNLRDLMPRLYFALFAGSAVSPKINITHYFKAFV